MKHHIIDAIMRTLKGKMYNGYVIAFCPCHNNTKTPALTARYDKQTDKLLVKCHAGCNSVDILKTLNQRGFLENFKHSRRFQNDYKQNNASDGFDKSQFIAKILQESCPIEGTLAERYLRQTRGISCPLSSTLKYHSNLYHSPSKQLFPAMVGVVTDFAGLNITAIHRTYLNHYANKAEIENNKMMFGKVCGGGVFLNRSSNMVLVVSEGIETGLSLKEFYPDTNVVATLSTAGMKAFILPEPAGKLIIGIDNDTAGMQAGNALATRAYANGWEVSVITPPEANRDWNDFLIKTKQDKGIIQ